MVRGCRRLETGVHFQSAATAVTSDYTKNKYSSRCPRGHSNICHYFQIFNLKYIEVSVCMWKNTENKFKGSEYFLKTLNMPKNNELLHLHTEAYFISVLLMLKFRLHTWSISFNLVGKKLFGFKRSAGFQFGLGELRQIRHHRVLVHIWVHNFLRGNHLKPKICCRG